MLQAFVITLREGLEAFLIIAISLAYLRKSGRHQLIPAVHWGIGVSVLLSIGAGMLFQRASNQALWEGVLALVAAVLVASLIVHMWRHARRMKQEIEEHLEQSALKVGPKALAGVFLFTLLMITREGMETAMLMSALLFQVQASELDRSGGGHGVCGHHRVAMVTLWPSGESGTLLPSDLFVPGGVRGAVADLRLPRADRSQHLSVQ
jgi:high-affinity iron transporter